MEELLTLLESTANLLRGMTLDAGVPKRIKGVMFERASEIDKIITKYADGE